MTSMQEYAEATHHGNTAHVPVAQMTDREIAEETLTRLRKLDELITQTLAQIGPSFAALQANPILGRMLGGR